MSTVILLGTSARKGHTNSVCQAVAANVGCKVIMLADYSLSYYDYEHHNKNDDFIKLMTQLLEYDHIVFASPVYWYAMSGQLKVFFDRLTDLLTIERAVGRALKGKSCSVIATGTDKLLPPCFVDPFRLTANYLGMIFQEVLYCSSVEQNFVTLHEHEIKDFASRVN